MCCDRHLEIPGVSNNTTGTLELVYFNWEITFTVCGREEGGGTGVGAVVYKSSCFDYFGQKSIYMGLLILCNIVD